MSWLIRALGQTPQCCAPQVSRRLARFVSDNLTTAKAGCRSGRPLHRTLREGLFGPSLDRTPPCCVLLGQPAAVQVCSGQTCRTRRGSHPAVDVKNAKRPTRGRFAFLAEREGLPKLSAIQKPMALGHVGKFDLRKCPRETQRYHGGFPAPGLPPLPLSLSTGQKQKAASVNAYTKLGLG